jgi:hypothetical protein
MKLRSWVGREAGASLCTSLCTSLCATLAFCPILGQARRPAAERDVAAIFALPEK